MKSHNLSLVIQFLNQLENNNNRDWFLANKSEYQQAKQTFERFVEWIEPQISLFVPSFVFNKASDYTFRITIVR
jgi:uncharacterized protein (DUF2461 family)